MSVKIKISKFADLGKGDFAVAEIEIDVKGFHEISGEPSRILVDSAYAIDTLSDVFAARRRGEKLRSMLRMADYLVKDGQYWSAANLIEKARKFLIRHPSKELEDELGMIEATLWREQQFEQERIEDEELEAKKREEDGKDET